MAEILIVDDCLFNIAALRSLILMFNYESDNCTDGQEAINIIKERVNARLPMYKLIMIDFSMPVVDGPSATSAIRSYLTEVGIAREHQPYICCMSAYSEKNF